MWNIWSLGVALLCIIFVVQQIEANIEHGIFQTKLDHFRPRDRRVVDFTYFVNNDFYEAGGPFYIFIKNMGDAGTFRIENGLILEIAQETGGAIFTFDHRFFGDNLLVDQFTEENLNFLTVEQALGDIVQFIDTLRRTTRYPRVILFGSGYGATLAAWTRKKYPHLVDGIWSSSGIFFLEDYAENYFEMVEQQLTVGGGEPCVERLQSVFTAIEDLIEAGDGVGLQTAFNLCDPIDTESVGDIGMLYESLIDFITDYTSAYDFLGVRDFCSSLNVGSDAVSAFVRWINFEYNPENTCFQFNYNQFVEATRQENNTNPARAFTYYQCTQLGIFPITYQYSWMPHRVTINYHIQKCADIFADYTETDLTEAVEGLILHFGSLNQRLTNVVYTNGNLDPFYLNAMIDVHDANATVMEIPFHSTSADLHENRIWDSLDLVSVKQAVKQTILDWVRLPL